MWADSKKKLRNTIADDIVAVIYTPLLDLINWPSKKIEEAKTSLTSNEELKKDNKALRKRNLDLQRRLLEFKNLQAKVITYKQLLKASQDVRDEVQLAEIYHITLDPKKQLIKINLGTRDFVVDDQPLIDSYGVMGQIIRARLYDSTVRLVTDQNHIMHVQFKRDGLRTLARGTGESRLIKLPYLPKSAEIKVGDKIITSGLGGVYPHGYPVGEVINILNPAGAKFITAIVQPAAHLDRTREAMVVWTDNVCKRIKLYVKINSTPATAKNGKTKIKKTGLERKCPTQ